MWKMWNIKELSEEKIKTGRKIYKISLIFTLPIIVVTTIIGISTINNTNRTSIIQFQNTNSNIAITKNTNLIEKSPKLTKAQMLKLNYIFSSIINSKKFKHFEKNDLFNIQILNILNNMLNSNNLLEDSLNNINTNKLKNIDQNFISPNQEIASYKQILQNIFNNLNGVHEISRIQGEALFGTTAAIGTFLIILAFIDFGKVVAIGSILIGIIGAILGIVGDIIQTTNQSSNTIQQLTATSLLVSKNITNPSEVQNQINFYLNAIKTSLGQVQNSGWILGMNKIIQNLNESITNLQNLNKQISN